jgi:hypothetical protein
MKQGKRLLRHARADPAGIEQAPIVAVIAKQKRAEEWTRPFRVRPAHNDELKPG